MYLQKGIVFCFNTKDPHFKSLITLDSLCLLPRKSVTRPHCTLQLHTSTQYTFVHTKKNDVFMLLRHCPKYKLSLSLLYRNFSSFVLQYAPTREVIAKLKAKTTKKHRVWRIYICGTKYAKLTQFSKDNTIQFEGISFKRQKKTTCGGFFHLIFSIHFQLSLCLTHMKISPSTAVGRAIHGLFVGLFYSSYELILSLSFFVSSHFIN
jgi:hypothetical protein